MRRAPSRQAKAGSRRARCVPDRGGTGGNLGHSMGKAIWPLAWGPAGQISAADKLPSWWPID